MATTTAPPAVPAPTAPRGKDANFFQATTYNEAYWDDYMAARAKYSPDFYARILAYHRSHNPTPLPSDLAHDIGTGPGQVAAELAKHFDHVIASDTNATHLAVAATRLEKAGVVNAKEKVTWTDCGAEDLAGKYPASEAALLTVAECLPLLDVPRAMGTFAHLLRPDGTLAIWFYGRPHFTEPAFVEKCQPLLNDILDMTFAVIIKGGNPIAKAAWKSATDTLESFLDNVALPADVWRDVYRYKWNDHLPLPVIGPNARDFDIDPSSSIDETNEKVVKEVDPKLWEEWWNVGEVRRFVECLIPSFEQQKAAGLYQHVEAKYQELEEAMGGKDAKRLLTWPVVLILATRR